MIYRLILICSLAFASPCFAQNATESSRWEPTSSPSFGFDLKTLVLAKADNDSGHVRFICPLFEYKKQKKAFLVQVQNKDGSSSYEEREVDLTVPFPKGSYRLNIPIEQIYAWDLDGKAIDRKVLASTLRSATHVLFETRLDPANPPAPIDPYYQTVLQKDAVRIQVPADAKEKFEQK